MGPGVVASCLRGRQGQCGNTQGWRHDVLLVQSGKHDAVLFPFLILYMYVYIYIYTHRHIFICMYIHIYRERERDFKKDEQGVKDDQGSS